MGAEVSGNGVRLQVITQSRVKQQPAPSPNHCHSPSCLEKDPPLTGAPHSRQELMDTVHKADSCLKVGQLCSVVYVPEPSPCGLGQT